MLFNLRERTILFTVAGSRAYGIHLPTSDVDVKGVCVPTAPYIQGFQHRFEQADKPLHMGQFLDLMNEEEQTAIEAEKLEGTVYEIRKFMSLAADANPNILDLLFCRDAEVRLMTDAGRALRENREMFLSARAKFTFSGYAASQLHRIKGHRKWLLDPPKHQPTRAEFGLPEFTLVPVDHLAAANAAVRKQVDSWEIDFRELPEAEKINIQGKVAEVLSEISTALGMGVEGAKWLAAARMTGLNENLIQAMQREREYEAAARYWKQYENWRLNRNPARAALEAKYGMDCKHAGHLFRLLKMGREILETGRVHVWRGVEDGGPGDADEIRSIRNGAWSYERLIEWAEQQDQELTSLYNERRYVVPKSPNKDALDTLCMTLVRSVL